MEYRVVVFADDSVVGHVEIIELSQGFSSAAASGEEFDARLARLFDRDDEEVEVGHGSYLVTASLQLLGLGVRPGRMVALLRADDRGGQASIVFHQASDDSPVPPHARNTAVVPGWRGSGWAEPAQVRNEPDNSPTPDWPINSALRKLGVQRGDHPDEIAAVGLLLPTASGS